MEKKELKFYEVPQTETIVLELEGQLLDASSDPSTNPFDDSTSDTEIFE